MADFTPQPDWQLMQRDDCHLCDLALEVLAAARFPEFESVFIEDDPSLESLWGDKVPVMLDVSSGAFIAWPFNENTLQEFRQGVEDLSNV